MNIRALGNFISLPYTSSNSGKAVGLYRDVSKSLFKNCVFVLFFLTYIKEKRSRSNTGEQLRLMLIFSIFFKA